MIVGECDCACLDSSQPPAWSSDSAVTTEYSQMAPAGSEAWAVVANVENGSHCGYLTEPNAFCSTADNDSNCTRCKDKKKYKPVGKESDFTAKLFKEFIDIYPANSGFTGTRQAWLDSSCLKWLDNQNPIGTSVKLVQFKGGKYVYHV